MDEFSNSNVSYAIRAYAISLLYDAVNRLLNSRTLEDLKYNLGYIDALKNFISLDFLNLMSTVEVDTQNIVEFNRISREYLDKITKLIRGEKL